MSVTRPHIVLVIARGEAVRNFLYSDTLPVLSRQAHITLLSVIHDDAFRARFQPYVSEIVPLEETHPGRLAGILEDLAIHAHYRWQWSAKARNKWEILSERAVKPLDRVRLAAWKSLVRMLANRPAIEGLTRVYRSLASSDGSTRNFISLLRRLQPDLVFNTSHVHGNASTLPLLAAARMGIPTAAFIFSWDNLTSRSRILIDYDHYLVWHKPMQDQLRAIYPNIPGERIHITGTPQFDYHFDLRFSLSRPELAKIIGFDPARPYILYTTGMASDFPEEHRHVEAVIRTLQEIDPASRPQLVVRTYIKGTTPEMWSIAEQKLPDVYFPPIMWDQKWYTPEFADLAVYSSLLRHTALGINAASTVSLELIMQDKPVINLGFDPPGSSLPHSLRWKRHIGFDHYRPVVESGAVMLACQADEIREYIHIGMNHPQEGQKERRQFLAAQFDGLLDGCSGERVANSLLQIANHA